MQNANIKYLIRIEKGEHINREVEINMQLSDFESDIEISDVLEHDFGIYVDGWGSEYYTVIERNIELFNED